MSRVIHEVRNLGRSTTNTQSDGAGRVALVSGVQ